MRCPDGTLHDRKLRSVELSSSKVGTYDVGLTNTTLEVAQEVARKVTAAAPAQA